MVFDARRSGPPPGGPGGVASDEPDPLSDRFPTVVAFLTLTLYGDGARRLPGSITLFADGSVLKACLNDKDAGLSAFVSGAGLEGLLTSMEEGLKADRLDWRSSDRKRGKRF